MRNQDRLPSKHFVAKAIYGLIAVLAVLVTMEDHPPVAWRGAVTLFGTTLAVALADLYSETIGRTLSHQRRPSRTELREIWHDVSPVLIGAQVPTLVLLLSATGLFSTRTAIFIAEVLANLLLFGYGWRAGQAQHRHWFRQLMSALFLVAIGGLIVGIKALFH